MREGEKQGTNKSYQLSSEQHLIVHAVMLSASLHETPCYSSYLEYLSLLVIVESVILDACDLLVRKGSR